MVWAAAGSSIFVYDLRKEAIVLAEATRVTVNTDEINQLAYHPKGQFVASCDDSGAVKLIDPTQHTAVRTLKGRHANICSSVAFRPKSGQEST
jgi:WD40 repeat protein